MPLRSELQVRDPDAALVEQFSALGEAIVARVDAEEDCPELLAELDQRTRGMNYARTFFADLGCDIEDFAERAALGAAPYVPDIERHELVHIVELIDSSSCQAVSDYYVDLFCRNVPRADGSDLLFHPGKYWPDGYEPTAAEVVERALAPDGVIRL